MPSVSKAKWRKKVERLLELRDELRSKPEDLKVGVERTPDGILHGYLVGDLTKGQAIHMLEQWRGAQGDADMKILAEVRKTLNRMQLPELEEDD